MYEPLISIIVPVYNPGVHLNRCVESILDQSYPNLELILIDDGSTDSSPKLCDGWLFRDSRVKVIHKKNGGAGSARNAGLRIAEGEYIGFVDSDDWIEKEMYERLFQLLKEYQADMSVCGMRITLGKFAKKTFVQPRISIWNNKECLDRFFRINGEEDSHSVCGALYKKELFQDFSFVEKKMNEDLHACYFLAVRCRKTVQTNEVYYHYFYNINGVTHRTFTEQKFDLLDIWLMVKELVPAMSPAYIRECDMNYKRACFTLLSRMYIDGYDKKDPVLVSKKQELKHMLREAYPELMRWKMPISRKILMSLEII